VLSFWHQRAIRDLIRRHGIVKLATVLATDERSFVEGAVAIVAVIAHGDGVPEQLRPRILRRVLTIALHIDMQPDHAPRLTHIELWRQVVRLFKLIFAPTPSSSGFAKFRWHSIIILQEINQPHIVAQMLVKNPLPCCRIALRPFQVCARPWKGGLGRVTHH
jgi:hypothetical protein